MDIPTNIVREDELDHQREQEAQEKNWLNHAIDQCKTCIACHKYPEGTCCTVQAEKKGKPYLIKDMEKCPGLPNLTRTEEQDG
jgi:hypothetical protein